MTLPDAPSRPAGSRRSLRVLHIAPSIARTYGGPAHTLWGYVRAAQLAGIDVTVAAPECDAGLSVDHGSHVDLRSFGAYGRGAFVISPKLWSWLRREGTNFDVVHVHGLLNPVSSVAARLCLQLGLPTVIRPFGTLSRFTFTYRRTAMKRAFVHLLDYPNLTGAAGVHFTTAGEMENAEWHGLTLGERAHVIPPPLPPATPVTGTSDNETPTILSLGRLHPIKAIESLLDSMPGILHLLPTTRLIVAGDGEDWYVRTLRDRAERLGIATAVDFVGFVCGAAKARLLASATVFAMPSHHESFGFAALEAVAAGVPVVLTPQVELADFVHAHGLGVITERDPAAFGGALYWALQSTELRAASRARGRATVEAAFSERTIGERLRTMYATAIERSHA